jgi:hypothetical protein
MDAARPGLSTGRLSGKRTALSLSWTAPVLKPVPARTSVAVLAILLAARVPANPQGAPSSTSASTREMAELLRQRAAAVNPQKLSLVVNDRRADWALRELRRSLPRDERLQMRGFAVNELINAGRIDDALAALADLERDAKTSDAAGWRRHLSGARRLRVLASLRLAEDQNCHLTSSRDACLLPIRGLGVHQRREGSTRAAELLEQILAEDPDDLRARWLLNIAHMTLGSYPDGVRERFRVPEAAFAPEHPLPRFPNVAREVGLDLYGLSGGAIVDDFDNDGRLDLVVSGIGFTEQMRYLWSRGDGTFEDRTVAAGLEGETGGLNLLQADYDNDGFLDVVVLRGGWMGTEGRFPLSLLRNQGDGAFTDVTLAARLLRFAPTQTAVFFDYDGDGWLDLFVGNESMPGDSHPCELFRNNRDGTFSERAREAGLDYVGFVKGVVSGDYNDDGRPDLYVSVMGGDNRLYRNDGPMEGSPRGWRFTEVAKAAGVTEPLGSFSTLFFDYDNDGWLDLFVSGYGDGRGALPRVEDVAADYLGLPTAGERGRLFRNRGDGTFADVTKSANLHRVVPAMGLNFGDLDNDGWLDFYAGTGTPDLGMLVPKRMFRNAEGRSFQDVTSAGNFGHLQKGHGIAFADLDNDGDQDVFEEMGGAYLTDKAYSALYLNPGNDNAWLGLELEGMRTNRRALGARIKVAFETKAGRRVVYRTVGSGGSFGASPLRQEIGLGEATHVEAVEVTWPVTGEVQRLSGLELRNRYRIREGSLEVQRLDLARFALGGRSAAPSPQP